MAKKSTENTLIWRNCDIQTHEPVYGNVNGEIPIWLEGTLIRNGAGIFQVGKTKYNSFFDGLSVLHKFSIHNGEVTYQSRALESDTYMKNVEAKRIVVSEFGTIAYEDPCHSLFQRFKSSFAGLFGSMDKISDNCNVSVAYCGDQLYAMTDSAFVHRIDPQNLKSLGKLKIEDFVAVNTATSHPHVLKDGTVFNIGNNFKNKKGPHYCIIKIPPSPNSNDEAESNFKHAKLVAEIPARWKMNPSYYHSFGITSNKIIFIESPLCMNIPKILTKDITKKSIRDCLQWYPNEKTRFYVASIKDGSIHPVIYETDGLFTFHHVNAYEEKEHLIVDVVGYDSGEIIMNPLISPTEKSGTWVKNATVRRFVLPLHVNGRECPESNLVKLMELGATAFLRRKSKSGEIIVDCTPRYLTDRWLELPQINYKYNGMRYNFLYGLSSEDSESETIKDMNIILKISTVTGKVMSWSMENIMASEPVFLADPTKQNPAEDDGVILSALIHKNDPQTVSLLILDARNMKEMATVKFRTEGSVPGTFHGIWSQGEKQNMH